MVTSITVHIKEVHILNFWSSLSHMKEWQNVQVIYLFINMLNMLRFS